MIKFYDKKGRIKFIWRDGDPEPTEIKYEDDEEEEEKEDAEESQESTQEVPQVR